jgi:primosomal protein N' (replication factor Y) (superfamily II helicase)
MLNSDLALPNIVSEPITGYAIEPKVSGFVEVLVDCPGIQALYTYNIPDQLSVQIGDILNVPLGGQIVGGIAIRLIDQLPDHLSIGKIKDIDDVVASGLFKASYWQWLGQIADYYYTPLIQVIKVALPPGLLTRSQRRIRSSAVSLTPAMSLGTPAKKILKLLEAQSDQNHSWQHIQKQIPQAKKGLRELLNYQLNLIWNRAKPKSPNYKRR